MIFRFKILGLILFFSNLIPGLGQTPTSPVNPPVVAPSAARPFNAPSSFPSDQNNPSYPLQMQVDMTPVWQRDLIALGLKHYRPIFTDERIFLIDKKRVIALSVADGEPVFDQTFDHTINTICPLGDQLFLVVSRIGLMGGKSWLIGYDIKRKQVLWEKQLGLESSFGLETDGEALYTFVLKPLGYWLHSFGLDGQTRWKIKTKGATSLMMFRGDHLILEPPGMNKVIALDRNSGKEVWAVDKGWGWSDLSMRGSEILVASKWVAAFNITEGIKLLAIDAKTGKEKWFHRIPAEDYLLSAEQVYGFTSDGLIGLLQTSRTLRAYTTKAGKEKWSLLPEKGFDFVRGQKSIILGKNVLVLQSKKEHTLLDLLSLEDGKRIGRSEVKDELLSGVKVLGQRLFFAFRHGLMVALPLGPEEAPGPLGPPQQSLAPFSPPAPSQVSETPTIVERLS